MARAAQGVARSGATAAGARTPERGARAPGEACAGPHRPVAEAASLRRAADIRTYVDAIEQETEREGIVASREEIASWARWARAQADTIESCEERSVSATI